MACNKMCIRDSLTMQDMTADRITAEVEVIHLKIISRIIVTVKITVRTIVIWIDVYKRQPQGEQKVSEKAVRSDRAFDCGKP